MNTNVDTLIKFVAVLLLLAVIRLDWSEGSAIAEARSQAKGKHAGFISSVVWWIASLLDDLFAAGVLIATIRIIGGGSMMNLLFALPWIATTLLILKSAGSLKVWDFLEKIADDVRDGWALATFIMFWMGWTHIIVPNFNISF